MKTCTTCKIEKQLIDFSKNKSHKDGYSSQCKECVKQYKIKNADKINDYKKQYNIENKDKKISI